MEIDTDELDRLAEDDDYPGVIGADNKAEYALDHVYAAIEENVEDDNLREGLLLVPGGYLRGTATVADVRLILDDLRNRVSGDEKVREAISEAEEYLA
jgi:hypothetical protein